MYFFITKRMTRMVLACAAVSLLITMCFIPAAASAMTYQSAGMSMYSVFSATTPGFLCRNIVYILIGFMALSIFIITLTILELLCRRSYRAALDVLHTAGDAETFLKTCGPIITRINRLRRLNVPKEIYVDYGEALYEAGDLDGAANAFETYLQRRRQRKPPFAGPRCRAALYLALMAALRGDGEKAAHWQDALAELSQPDANQKRAQSYGRTSRFYREYAQSLKALGEGRYTDGKAFFQSCQKQCRNNLELAHTYCCLAVICAGTGEEAKAALYLDLAAGFSPNLYSLTLARKQLGLEP